MTTTGSTSTIDQLEARLEKLESMSILSTAPTPVIAPPPRMSSLWITNALQSITLAAIVGGAFWLGSLSSTVSNTSAKVDKLTESISGVSKESLSNRTRVLESRLSVLEIRLSALETKVDERTSAIESRLGALETKLNEISRKLDRPRR